MKTKIGSVVIFVLISSFTVTAQVPESIQNYSSEIFLSYSKIKIISNEKLDSLGTIFSNDISNNDFEKIYNTPYISFLSLGNNFASFRTSIKDLSADSAMFLFNQWYLDFANTFYDYFKKTFLESEKTKILFFSASVSCYCTLKMCHDQLTDILDFVNKSDDKYDYFVVDSYEHNDLQIEYDTFFAPSVAVLDRSNKILLKLEYEEKMKDQLLSFFKDYQHK